MLPTSTMGPGLFSERSAELIAALRAAGVIFVYVTGARKSTMIQRLPLLAPADFAVAETGGRMYVTAGSVGSDPLLDPEWTRRIEAEVGPIEAEGTRGIADIAERQGALWDWCRELTRRGLQCDTRAYTCCFRVDCKADGAEAKLKEAIAAALPHSVSCAQNLGKYVSCMRSFGAVVDHDKAAFALLRRLCSRSALPSAMSSVPTADTTSSRQSAARARPVSTYWRS